MVQFRVIQTIGYLSLPQVLIIVLERYQYNQYLIKNTTPVEIPLQLNAPNPSDQSNTIKYNLVSVVLHSGTASHGHNRTISKFDNKWYEFSDIFVREITYPCLGMEHDAYIMFYQKE